MEIDRKIYSTVIFPLPRIQLGQLSVTGNSTEVGLSLPRNSVVKLTDCPTMTIAVYRGHKANKESIIGHRCRPRNPNPRVNGLCRKRGLPSFRHYPLTRGLGFLGLHRRPKIDYFSYLLLEKLKL